MPIKQLRAYMKKCANCGLESSNETISCPSCSTDTFVSETPQQFGHTISPVEERYWEHMNFRQFAVFLIRLQAVWLLFYAIEYLTYLHSYWIALDRYKPGFPGYTDARHTFFWALFRIALHIGGAFLCIRWADRIVSWLVRDVLPKPTIVSDDDKPVA